MIKKKYGKRKMKGLVRVQSVFLKLKLVFTAFFQRSWNFALKLVVRVINKRAAFKLNERVCWRSRVAGSQLLGSPYISTPT